MAKKKIISLDLKMRFNDIVMRELGLGITDDDYIYDMDTESILQIKEKFIKYCDYENPTLKYNEIDLNLIENPRLMETLSLPYFSNYCKRNGITFETISQVLINGTNKGIFVLHYCINGETKCIESEPFINDSVRIFNLICKLNKTTNLYQFNNFDIEIERKK